MKDQNLNYKKQAIIDALFPSGNLKAFWITYNMPGSWVTLEKYNKKFYLQVENPIHSGASIIVFKSYDKVMEFIKKHNITLKK